MSAQTRTVLKAYFESDDYPTQAQFEDLIDSMYNIEDDGGGNLIWNVNGDSHYTKHLTNQDLLKIGFGTETPDSLIQFLHTDAVVSSYVNIGYANDVSGALGSVLFGTDSDLSSSTTCMAVGGTNDLSGSSACFSFGNINTLVSSNYSTVVGTGNNGTSSSNLFICGANNTLSLNGYSTVFGSGNSITSGSQITIFGDNVTSSGKTNSAIFDLLDASLTVDSDYMFWINCSKLRFTGLPTSSAGLIAGDVWNDGGTLKII